MSSLREGGTTTTAEGNSEGTFSIRGACGNRGADNNQSNDIKNVDCHPDLSGWLAVTRFLCF